MKVTKEEYFSTCFRHAHQFMSDLIKPLLATGAPPNEIQIGLIFGAILKASAAEGVVTLKKLHEQAFDVSEILNLTDKELSEWVEKNKIGKSFKL